MDDYNYWGWGEITMLGVIVLLLDRRLGISLESGWHVDQMSDNITVCYYINKE